MHLFITYQRIQLKRAFHKFPIMMGGFLLLSAIIGLIMYCNMNYYIHTQEKGVLMTPLQIDLVNEDTSSETTLAIQFVQSMESTKDILSFHPATLTQAYEDLSQKRAVAILVLPQGITSSILDGTNASIQVIFPESSDLSALILREFTNSGAVMLDAAQADIYALTELYLENDLQSFLQESYDQLNQRNLSYALARERLFYEQETSATGSSLIAYYMSSAVWLLLLLSGVCFASLLSRDSLCVREKLRQSGIHTPLQILARFITAFCVYFAFICILITLGIITCICFHRSLSLEFIPSFVSYGTGSTGSTGSTLSTICMLCMIFLFCIVCLLFVTAFVVFIYELTPNTSIGILGITIGSVLLLFLSGAFIPIAFFPDALKSICMHLPTTYLLQRTATLFTSTNIDSLMF